MIKKLTLMGTMLFAATLAMAQYQFSENYPGGQLLMKGEYSANPGILPTDSKEVAAQKLSKVTKTGTWSYFYENGKPSGIEFYTAAGAATGIWKTWYASGKLSTEINFATGATTYWYENGKKSAEGRTLQGMIQTGKWTNWHENGQKNSEGSFDSNGVQIGTWTFWDASGNKVAEQTWSNGELVSTTKF